MGAHTDMHGVCDFSLVRFGLSVVDGRSPHRTHVYIDHMEARLYVVELWLVGNPCRHSVNRLDNGLGCCHKRVDLHDRRI